MISPFQPLLQLVVIATSPWGLLRAVDVRSGGGQQSTRGAAASPGPASQAAPPARRDRHNAEPVTLASDYASQDVPVWDPVDRFRVLARDHQGTLWVTLNGISSQLPPPPDRVHGPVGCDCPDFEGQRGTRYGRMQDRNLRIWMADHYDGARPFAPYVPDLFCSLGPCFARTYRGALAQWDPDWVVPHEDGVQIQPAQRAIFVALSRTDDAARKALRIDARPDVPAPRAAQTPEELHEQYGHWVAHRLETRGRILERLLKNNRWREFQDKFHSLWLDMRDAGYFSHVPIGMWVQDTHVLVDKILELQHAGVPVYYRWRSEFDDSTKFPRLAALRPSFADETRIEMREPDPIAAPVTPEAPAKFTLPARSVLWSPNRRQPPENTYAVHVADQREPSSTSAEPQRVDRDTPAPAGIRSVVVDLDDEAFWDQANKFLDAQEKSTRAPPKLLARLSDPGTERRVPGPVESAASTTKGSRPAPRVNSRFVIQPPPLAVRVENDKPYRSAVRGRVAVQMKAGAAESVNRDAGSSSYQVVAGDRLPRTFEERITVDPRHVEQRLFILETEVAEEFVNEYLHQNPTATILEITRFLLDRRMPFNLTFPLRGVDTRGQAFPRTDYSPFIITPGLSLPDSYSRWLEGGREVLSVERVKRAVAARGGMLARVARLLGLDTTFRRYPSAFVCTSGGPNLVGADPQAGMFYYDDWITQEEIDLLLGVVVEGKVSRSIMPPLEMFNTFYAGAWGKVYEDWFRVRLREIDSSLKKGDVSGFFIPSNGWNKRFKGYAFT